MSFRVTGLDPAPFRRFYGLTDEALAEHGVKRYIADAPIGYPDRVQVRDATPGETLLLLNYEHQPADTAYRSSHAIFVLEGADEAFDGVDVIPKPLQVRPISLRGFTEGGEMVTADLVDGRELAPLVERFFEDPEIAYLHAHYAKRGCYAARFDRA